MSRPGIAELAKRVAAIRDKREMTYTEVAQECCGKQRYLGITKGTISGLCNSHALRPDFEPWIKRWVEANG